MNNSCSDELSDILRVFYSFLGYGPFVLYSDLDDLINECLEEKKRAITICENIAEIDGYVYKYCMFQNLS